MEKVSRRVTTVALAAVLLFMACVPVPVGASAFDRLRLERAEAAVPLAVPVVLGAVAAGCGFLVAGSTLTDYNANLQAVYDGLSNGTKYWSETWTQYCKDKGGFDNAMNSMVIDGKTISIHEVQQSGLFDTVQTYSLALVDEEKASFGLSSIDIPKITTWNYDGYTWNVYNGNNVYQSQMQPYIDQLAAQGYTHFVGFGWSNNKNEYYAAYSQYGTLNASYSDGVITLNGSCETVVVELSNGAVSKVKRSYAYPTFRNVNHPNYNWANCLATNEIKLNISGVDYDDCFEESKGDYVGVVDEGVYDGSFSMPDSDYEIWEPTAEQLEAGYTVSDVVQAIDAGNASLDGIAAGIGAVQSLLAPLAGIAAGVQTLVNDWAGFLSTPISWLQSWWNTLTGWWQQLLAWIGATPFGTVMGTVIDGVQAIPGAVTGAADAVVSGVQAIPGMLEGVLEGILEGVQSIPVSIGEVIAAIQAGVVDLTGALDVALEPPQVPNSGEGLRLRDELRAQLDAMLDMKAPFCYMRSMQALAAGIAGNFGGEPNFYFDLDIPFAGTQRFDAGPLLNQAWGSRSVADYVRIMLTASMCAGLLAVSLKIAIGRIGRKED